MQNKIIEKLKKQVDRYEAKGYTNTAAHQMLAKYLAKPVASVKSRNAEKSEQEIEEDGE